VTLVSVIVHRLLHCWFLQVAAAVKGLSMADILAYEKSGSIELAGHTLGEGDVKVTMRCLAIVCLIPQHSRLQCTLWAVVKQKSVVMSASASNMDVR
jgi:hypothetical protein